MSKENKEFEEQHISSSVALDDEQRIKVLSPGMLVFKRFIRNRLAIVGVVAIIAMFLFSFVGGWVMPYGEDEVFTKIEPMSKDYAGVTRNETLRYTIAEGANFSSVAQSQFVLAINNGETAFTAQGAAYTLEVLGEDLYAISGLVQLAKLDLAQIGSEAQLSAGFEPGENFTQAMRTAATGGQSEFSFNGETYQLVQDKKVYTACRTQVLALASKNVFSTIDTSVKEDFALVYNSFETYAAGGGIFTLDGVQYRVVDEDGEGAVYIGDEQVAYINPYIVQALHGDVFLTREFKLAALDAIEAGEDSFVYVDESGTENTFTILRKDKQWTVRQAQDTQLIDSYRFPDSKHLLGTDGNGMDMLTRLMYGGRVSLLIGFIVVIIETFIGVILGGIAGYFGKWVDNLLMRLVDIFNCIPQMPLIIILGAMMDELRVSPQTRMVYLMVILGVLGWPSIARLVRGQILSLREQEFMTAAEATGISVSRRIFKHLVPNVIPQLIVICTMSLGGVILTEATLSFLGLGVKFPFASWGNIINAVSNVHVMKSYLFVWIPAGMCILITVLGFNFIGDGLRDAFDPKMKR